MTSYAESGIKIRNNHIIISDAEKLQSPGWDGLVYAAVFGDRDTKIQTRWAIGEVARLRGIKPASINALYRARGRGDIDDTFTVPALNLKGMAYDSARAIFAVMVKHAIGTVIFELAKSEMEYTAQSPEEYTTVILAAAVREGYRGPIFLQADHTQLKAKSPGVAADNEKARLEHHIKRCVRADFFNIDIDGSTLVDLSLPDIGAQQASNIEWTSLLTRYIRDIQPVGLPISVGGEIGHIGDKNSTVEEFEVFMQGLKKQLGDHEGLSKVSVQTGTSHGGVVSANGTLGKMKVDFSVLEGTTKAGKKYELGGSVQHGASTLPDSEFHLFPSCQTLEIHLATGWQNILFDSRDFPKMLKKDIYQTLLRTKSDDTLTDAQFLYKNRKRAWGDFKQATWDIEEEVRASLRSEVAHKATTIFAALNIRDTLPLAIKFALYHNHLHSVHDYQGD